jgi:SOS-response transcriptional repressor LexA
MSDATSTDPEVQAIFRAMAEQGRKKADLARLLEIDSSQVTRILQGRRRLRRDEWKKVEAWLSDSLDHAIQETAEVSVMPGMVPLYGWAGAATADRLVYADQTLLGAVPRHPNQANVMGAYALQISGDSMMPRYEPGEIIYIAPNQWPGREKDCVMVSKEGYGYIKRFVGQANGVITLHQLNPAEDLAFPTQDVAAMHAVVGRG